MRKTQNVLVVLLILASMLVIPITLAEEDEEVLVISSSPEEDQIPSAFRFGWEKFKLNFVKNQTIRAERELQLARWKIAEARVATRNGNMKRAEKAMEAHEQILRRVQDRVSKMENNSMTPGLDNAIRVHRQRLASLNMTLQNANLSEEQRVRIEARIGKTDNVADTLERNRDRIQQRIHAQINDFERNYSEIEKEGLNSLSNITRQ